MMNFFLGASLLFGLIGQGAFGANVLPSSRPANLENIEIDRIDILGVTVFPSSVLEGKLEISPGDRLTRLKVLATEKNIQELYLKHGYGMVRLETLLTRKKSSTQTPEIVLEFRINEGKPVRVSAITIVPVGFKDHAAEESFQSKAAKMRSSIPLAVGDVLDDEKVAEGKRAIQELLASQEYIGGRIAEVRTLESSAPPLSSLTDIQKASAQKWVTVEVRVDVGERVLFGYQGNQAFTLGYLDSLISEQRLLGLGKDYVNAIKMRIEEEYRSVGYARVRVTPYVFESHQGKPRRVSYVIEEGPRVRIKSIEFDGNTVFASKELREAFYLRASTLVQHRFYVEKDLQKAGESLIEYLKEKGYLSAKLITINTSAAPRRRGLFKEVALNILFYIYEGDQTRVHSVKVDGNRTFSREAILDLLGVQENVPLNLYKLSEGLEAIKKSYREIGYLDVKILNEGVPDLVTYSQENRVADLLVSLEEGPQFKVSHIEVEGLVMTQEFVVLRELKFKVGDILKQPALEQTERSLRRMGIFANVGIRITDDVAEPGSKIVRITLVEGDRGILSFGPGYRYDLGVRTFGQLAFTNLWGLNHAISLNLTANRRFYDYNFAEGQAQLAYTWPWFLLPAMTFRPVISAGRTQYREFSADTLSVSANFDKQILSNPNFMGYFTYSFESIDQFAANKVSDNRQMILGTITPKLSVDLRDNPLAPKSGFFGVAWVDLSSPALGSQANPFPIAYYRAQFRGDYYLALTKDIVWYFSFRTGFEQSQSNTADPNNPTANPGQDEIPVIKQFTMGGVGSLRGFREQALNYQLASIRGSLSYVNYRTQIDFPFAGALKFGLFLDAANLLKDNYSFGNLRFGTGFGFHYDTPVGPVSLDWGFNLAPQLDPIKGVQEEPYVVHFSVGVI
jgi:outer membrane protein insertion porin family